MSKFFSREIRRIIRERVVVFIFIASIFLNIAGITWLYWYSNQYGATKKTKSESLADRVSNNATKGVTFGKSIDVLNLPYNINSWNLIEIDSRWFFTDKNISQSLVYQNHDVSFVQLSPSHKKMGFYFRPEDHSLGEIVLAVLDIDKKVVKEVYRGDIWTSNWEWKGDNAVIVKRSCGTGCMNANVIDVKTGEKLEAYRVY